MSKSSADKIKELFNLEDVSNVMYQKTESGDMVIGKDEDGNDIIMKAPKTLPPIDSRSGNVSGMEQLLKLDMELVKKLTSPEYKEAAKQKERLKDIASFNRSLIREGVDPDSEIGRNRLKLYEQSKKYMKFPKVLDHYINDDEIEEYKDELTLEEKEYLIESKRKGLYITPQMVIGSRRSNKMAGESMQFFEMEYNRYLSSQGIDISLRDERLDEKYKHKFLKDRRPGLFLVIDECIAYLEKTLLSKLEEDKSVPESFVESYRNDRETRERVIANGTPYTIDDFQIFAYYFKTFGRHVEDNIYFNREYVVYGDVKMGDYIDKFKERTGFDFLDVYYHFYKLDEEREAKEANIVEKNDDESIGEENIDNVVLKTENKEPQTDEELIEDFMDGVEF